MPLNPDRPKKLIHSARIDLADGRPLAAVHKLRSISGPEPEEPSHWILRARRQQLLGDASMLLAGHGRFATHIDTAADRYSDAQHAISHIPPGNTQKLYQAAIAYGQTEVMRVQGSTYTAILLGMFARSILMHVGPAINHRPDPQVVPDHEPFGDEAAKLEGRRFVIEAYLTRSIGLSALQHGGLDAIAFHSLTHHRHLAATLLANPYENLQTDATIEAARTALQRHQSPLQRNFPVGPIIGPAIDLPDAA